MVANSDSTFIALDVGERRIGIAAAHHIARLAHPLKTLDRNDQSVEAIKQLVTENRALALVVGQPRNLSGQETAQTAATLAFVDQLKAAMQVPIYLQDEAVTSRKAEEELRSRGKPYVKGDIDALAATYILEDFLRDHPEVTA
jgi:putative Holliday junction resolvase